MPINPEEFLRQNETQLVEELQEFVRIPSQSGDPDRAPDVKRAAEWVAGRLRRAGLENVEILPTAGHPLVYADWLHAPDAPTVLVYGHYDVQPPEPLALWTTPPYRPEVRDGKLFGRGASDDKAGVMAAIAGAEAYLAHTERPGINLRFCIEGEEEIGSPNIRPLLVSERPRFACDLVISADGTQWSADQPQVVLSLRGGCALEVHVYGPVHDLHSGLYGGAILNPLEALARILASLRTPEGRIAVVGFYDDVVAPTAHDREQIARVPIDEAAYQAETGVPALHGEAGFTTLERSWIRPTVEINGMWGGHSGAGPKTIIPAEAHAKLTCRLVANQDPGQIVTLVERHIRQHAPSGVRVEVTTDRFSARPYFIAADHPAVRCAVEVLTVVYGTAPYEARIGGSIPVMSVFEEVLGAPTIFLGASTNEDNFHAPNEFVYLRSLHRAARCFSLLFARLESYHAE
jgi:acetylornithine deacetylase/succinyl-diaminopimelate desuccinylase-like protein